MTGQITFLLAAIISSVTLVSAQFDYNFAALQRHNIDRARHGAQGLSLDRNLMWNAMRCAQYYGSTGRVDHSCPYKNGAGENIFYTWTRRRPPSEMSMAIKATDLWYGEVRHYNPRSRWITGEYRHFTQMVWKTTKRLGVAVYNVRSGAGIATYVIALYSPRGNVQGQYVRNV